MQVFHRLAIQYKSTQVDGKSSVCIQFMVFYNLRELASQLVNLIGLPSQVCTQVLVLQTCIDLRVHLVRDLWCVTQFTNKLMMLFFLICSQVIKDLQVKTQYHRLIANSFVVVSRTYSIFNCILCVVRCLSVLIIIGPSRLSITSWHEKSRFVAFPREYIFSV